MSKSTSNSDKKDSANGNQSDQQDKAKDNDNEQQPAPTILAWAVRGTSLALIIFLLGYFIYGAIQPQTEPSIGFLVKNDDIEQRAGGWSVPVDVINESSMSVNTLSVTMTLEGTEEQSEKSVVIKLLGPREMITIHFWFDEDPREKGISTSVESYLLP